MAYWLMKSEPSSFGIQDLARASGGRSAWDGVRNYQARNFLRKMRLGDEAFFYHSGCAEPGIAGRMRIVREAYPDPTQFDSRDPHHDPASRHEAPRWYAVDVEFIECCASPLTLRRMRTDPRLDQLVILRRGNRLSITPISARHWRHLVSLSNFTTDEA